MINENTTVREFLQLLGTECIRNNLHNNMWVAATFADYKPVQSKSDEEMFEESLILDSTSVHVGYPNWIITDTRFPNEAEAIKERGGIVIRVNRKSDRDNSDINRHPSETGLDNWNFDYVIDNNGTIEDLIEKVRVILKNIKNEHRENN